MSGGVVAAAAAEGGVRASAVTDGLVGLYAAAERLHAQAAARRQAARRAIEEARRGAGRGPGAVVSLFGSPGAIPSTGTDRT